MRLAIGEVVLVLFHILFGTEWSMRPAWLNKDDWKRLELAVSSNYSNRSFTEVWQIIL